jgi:DNA-binding CsgD family transcriptional regulator
MARLTRTDLEAALTFAAEVGEAIPHAHRSDAWLLERMARLVDAEVVGYWLLGGQSETIHEAEFPGPGAERALEDAGPEVENGANPFCTYAKRTGDRYFSARRLSDVMPAPGGLEPSSPIIQMRLPAGPGTHWCLDLMRLDKDFSDRDVLMVNALRPALLAYETQRSLAAMVADVGIVVPVDVPPALLTTREMEILDLVASGESNKQIAYRLAISPGTVKKHLENVYAKLEVGSRTAALARTGRSTTKDASAGISIGH